MFPLESDQKTKEGTTPIGERVISYRLFLVISYTRDGKIPGYTLFPYLLALTFFVIVDEMRTDNFLIFLKMFECTPLCFTVVMITARTRTTYPVAAFVSYIRGALAVDNVALAI